MSDTCEQGLMRSGVTGDGAGLAPRSRRMVENLLVPWLIWQLFYLAYNYRTTYPVQFWAPIGITWYLSSLFMWRGSVQYVGGLRHALPLTFAAGECDSAAAHTRGVLRGVTDSGSSQTQGRRALGVQGSRVQGSECMVLVFVLRNQGRGRRHRRKCRRAPPVGSVCSVSPRSSPAPRVL